jgi:hypothetical protein
MHSNCIFVVVTAGDQAALVDVLLGTGRVGRLVAAEGNGQFGFEIEASTPLVNPTPLVNLVAKRVGCTIEIL